MREKFKKYLPALLSGIFVATSYIPFPPWAVLFCYTPLWYFWIFKAQNKKEVFWSGFWTQFVLSLIGFHWIFHVSHEFGGIPYPISILVLLLFASLQHIYIPLLGLIVFFIREKKWIQHPLSLSIFAASLLTLIEYYYPSLFQWHLGYVTLFAQFPIYHLADVIGFSGIAWMILLVNAGLTYAISFHPKKEKVMLHAFIWLFGFLILNFMGSFHGKTWSQLPKSTIQFLPIQANIGNLERLYAERGKGYQDYITDTFIQMSTEALQKNPEGQVFIWPESAFPEVLDEEILSRSKPQSRVQRVLQFLKNVNRTLITGSYSREMVRLDKSPSADDKVFNALSVIGPELKTLSPPYRKKHLLAFGEYTPFSDLFPALKNISPAGAGFDHGPGPMVLNVLLNLVKQPLNQINPANNLSNNNNTNIKLGPQICYESLDPLFSKSEVLDGAQILINVTNDSWFGPHSEPLQHLYMTLARAIENRRPLVRVTNTGITTAIEANGKIFPFSPLFQKWTGSFTIHYEDHPSLTLFTQYGQYIPLFVVLFILGLILFDRIHRKSKI